MKQRHRLPPMKKYVVGILLMTSMSWAFGQTPDFKTLDVDGNRLVSRDEARALPCVAEEYDRIERESEEGLSRREFREAVRTPCGGLENRRPSDATGGHTPRRH